MTLIKCDFFSALYLCFNSRIFCYANFIFTDEFCVTSRGAIEVTKFCQNESFSSIIMLVNVMLCYVSKINKTIILEKGPK